MWIAYIDRQQYWKRDRMINICMNALGKWKLSANKWQQLIWQLTSKRWLTSKGVDHVGIYRAKVAEGFTEFSVAAVSVADMMATSRRERLSTWSLCICICPIWFKHILFHNQIYDCPISLGFHGSDGVIDAYVCTMPQIQYMFNHNALCWVSDLGQTFLMKLSGNFPSRGDEAQHHFLCNSPCIDF